MKTLHVDRNNLSEVLQSIENILSDVDEKKRYKALLVCDEILTNQLQHGIFDTQSTDIKIDLHVDTNIQITFYDNAKRFNPLETISPDLKTTLDEIQPGGLGIFLVKQYATKIEYTYTNGYNILKVIL